MELGDDTAKMKDQVTPIEEGQGEDQEEVDRISALPDDLVHHIMSLMPTKETTRMAVLSKRWEFLWLTFPTVEFDELWFYPQNDNETSRRLFLQFLRQSLPRRQFNHTQKLWINTVLPHDCELSLLVNRCVTSAILRGQVQQLHLRIKNPPDPLVCDHYVVPRAVFSSGFALVSLILEDCQCGDYHKVSFPSLKNLTMRFVHISSQLIHRVISNSPKVETLRLEFCHGLDALKVFNAKLRNLILVGCNELVAFEIDTPSLSYFRYSGLRDIFRNSDGNGFRRDHYYTEISQFTVSNDKSFCSLKTLELSFVKMNGEIFRSTLSTFPNVETIQLVCSIFVKIPSILLQNLKSVEMKNCQFNELVEFNAPNLKTLVDKGGHRPCKLKYFGGMGFRSLKTVWLAGFVGLTDNSLRELLSSCILLKKLYLKSLDRLQHLNVISSTLKSLIVDSCFNLLDGGIHAPKLEYFQYIGKLVQFSPIISSSDLDADLRLVNSFSDLAHLQQIELKKLLRNFGQARVLRISSYSTKYLVFTEEVATPFLAPLLFLPHLKIQALLPHTSLLGILLGALRTSFCRETLYIEVQDTTLELKFQKIEEARKTEFSQAKLDVHDCIQEHLTEMRFEDFHGSTDEMELLTYILYKAQLLKNMFIDFSEELPDDPSIDISEMVSRIMNYPKASQKAQITFL